MAKYAPLYRSPSQRHRAWLQPPSQPDPRGHEPHHTRSHLSACQAWLCVSSEKRFQVSGGRCGGWGAGELGTRQSPPPRGGLRHGVPVFGPRRSDHWADVQCHGNRLCPAGGSSPAGVCAQRQLGPARGPWRSHRPGFLQLLRVPCCGCAKALGPRLPPGGDRGGGPAGQRQPGSPSAWSRVAGSSPTDPRVPPPFPSPGWGRRAAGCSPAAPAPPVSALWAGGRRTSPAAAPTALRLPRAGVLPSCCCRQGHEPTATSSLWRQAGGVQGTSVLLTGDPRLSEGREHGQGRARSSQSPAPPTGPGLPPRHTQARVCTQGHAHARGRVLTCAHSPTHPSSTRDGFPAQKRVPPGVSGRNLHRMFPEPRDEGLQGSWGTGPLSIAVLRVCPSWYLGSQTGA